MLRAITTSGDSLILAIDATEYDAAALPAELLTDSELNQVRAVLPDALPGYVTIQPSQSDEPDQP